MESFRIYVRFIHWVICINMKNSFIVITLSYFITSLCRYTTICPFYYWLEFGVAYCIFFFSIANCTAMNILVYIFRWTFCAFLFAVDRGLELQVMGDVCIGISRHWQMIFPTDFIFMIDYFRSCVLKISWLSS